MRDATEKYIIFDMDGVLMDSEPVIEAAAIAGLKEYGVCAKPEDFIPFIGTGEDRYIGGVAEKYGLPYKQEMKHRVYEIYLDMVDDKLKTYDGTVDLLYRLKKEGWSLALASSADRIKIDANLRVAGIDPGLFDVIISGEDVENKKPSPDIYLRAARKLNAAPAHCIVVEDARNGIQAARAAGMKCIGVATSFSQDELKDEGAYFVCNSINEIYSILHNL